MVSTRCKIAVKEVFRNLGLVYGNVELGEVELAEILSDDKLDELKISLLNIGFELIEDRRAILIERIKNIVIDMVHHSDKPIKVNFSDYLSEKLKYDYTYMANVFSEVQGISIEQFIISHKVERIKEYIIYDELNMTEIAFKMNYSSVAHLSGQFKKVTGLTPSYFKKLKMRRLEPIENI
jgi:AraC-like DNA-binding protein